MLRLPCCLDRSRQITKSSVQVCSQVRSQGIQFRPRQGPLRLQRLNEGGSLHQLLRILLRLLSNSSTRLLPLSNLQKCQVLGSLGLHRTSGSIPKHTLRRRLIKSGQSHRSPNLVNSNRPSGAARPKGESGARGVSTHVLFLSRWDRTPFRGCRGGSLRGVSPLGDSAGGYPAGGSMRKGGLRALRWRAMRGVSPPLNALLG